MKIKAMRNQLKTGENKILWIVEMLVQYHEDISNEESTENRSKNDVFFDSNLIKILKPEY